MIVLQTGGIADRAHDIRGLELQRPASVGATDESSHPAVVNSRRDTLEGNPAWR